MRYSLPLLLCLFAQPLFAQSITWLSPCSDKVFCLNQGSCVQGYGLMTEKAHTTCSNTGLNISYRIDFNNDGSTDLQAINDTVSGDFPLGTHRIVWRAADFCFNTSTCSYLFTVRDCDPPNMLCLSGMTQSIEQPECEAEFIADQFILNLSDNCTPANQIQTGIRKQGSGTGFPENSPSVSFGKCNAGVNFVEIWSRDGSGLLSQSVAYVLVQPNNGSCLCDSDGDIVVRGCTRQPDGSKAKNYILQSKVESFAGVTPPLTANFNVTNIDSCYRDTLTKLPFSGSYRITVSADKVDNPVNGVSTFDLLLISRNILGIQLLPSIYELLAADVNKSGTVTSFDIVAIRKVLLGISDTFPGVKSWQFIRSIADPANAPFSWSLARDTYQVTINNLKADQVLAAMDFIAIKSGDVNNSAQFDSLSRGLDDRSGREISLVYDGNRYLDEGDTAHITIRSPDFVPLAGWQLSISSDPDFWEWLGAEGEGVEYNILTEGRIRALWYNPAGVVSQKGGSPLVKLIVRAKRAGWWSNSLQADPTGPACEAYGEQDERHPIRLYSGMIGTGVVFGTPRPNPTSGTTAFGWILQAPAGVQLELWDVTGRCRLRKTTDQPAGAGSMVISAGELPENGLYLYRLSAGQSQVSGRLLIRQ